MQNSNNMVLCPYNNQHTMPQERLLWHLDKCPDGARLGYLFATFPYNTFHRMPKPQYEDHLRSCPDRGRNEDKIQEINSILLSNPKPFHSFINHESEYIPGLTAPPAQMEETNPWADYKADHPVARDYGNFKESSQSSSINKRGNRGKRYCKRGL